MPDSVSVGCDQSSFRVNCLIVGTQKGGTTALARFLAMHPDVCMAEGKEAHFFDADDFDESMGSDFIAGTYRRCFPAYAGQAVCCDATPIYMYLPQIAKRIHDYNPKMKLIFLLRNPASRAISHYHMERGRGFEILPLWMALLAEKFRLSRGDLDHILELRRHSYLQRGLYSHQIRRMLDYFPRDQMLFIRSERLQFQHEQVIGQVYAFLGLQAPVQLPVAERVFAGKYDLAKSPLIRYLLTLYFRRELKRLECLLSWDLIEWRQD